MNIMKKFRWMGIVLILLIGISACSKEDGLGDKVTETGTIKLLEASTFQYGSHILVDSQYNMLYALRSDKLNLNNYNDQNVKIVGNLIEGYPVDGGPDFVEVKAIETLNE